MLEVRQPEPLAAELLPENTVLLTHGINHVQLLSVDPSGHGDHEKRPGFWFHLAHRTSYRRPFLFWHRTGSLLRLHQRPGLRSWTVNPLLLEADLHARSDRVVHIEMIARVVEV
jgi:hypothetical protein